MAVSVETFERVALEDTDDTWEWQCGQLRRKPGMPQEHNSAAWWLGVYLQNQVDPDQFEVRVDSAHTRRPAASYFVPDVMVIPRGLRDAQKGTMRLETYTDPLPFVAEVWSPSTGDYDVDTKFGEYKLRGDEEIWRIHPYERTLIAWRRQPDGSYTETSYAGGEVPVESLPGVIIRLESLFR